MLWVELIIFLACIVIGARIGGIGMGTIAGIGLIIFVFLFRMPEGSPPVIVLGMILAVITALATMEAAGGMDYLVSVAKKVLHKNPKSITFVAPLVTYFLIMASGTQHVIYALLPVISEISRKAGVRPERPMSISVIAAMHGLIASPISAATAAILVALLDLDVTLPQILLIIIPSTLIAVLLGALSVAWRGKNLADDPVYQERLKKGLLDESEETKEMTGKELTRAKGSTYAFFIAVIVIVFLGMFPELRPSFDKILPEGGSEEAPIEMGGTIIMMMLATAGLIMILFKADAGKTVSGSIMKSGIIALISILGISWMGSSFFEANSEFIIASISRAIEGYQWVFAVGLFVLSILLFSQAATIATLMPVGVALGIPAPILIAVYPAVNGYFFLPTYGTIIAAVNFDQTGTTKIGKYLINHSFMLPGLVTTISAVAIALLITSFL